MDTYPLRYTLAMQRIEAYRNLHKGMWSVKSRQQPNYGRVVGWVPSILIENAYCYVNEKGRQRVIREGRKNVHAVVRGDWSQTLLPDADWQPLTYNPYRFETFVDRNTEAPVWFVPYVMLDEHGKAWYLPS